jgi:hypothetical protein
MSMPSAIDMTGQTFGRLTALSIVPGSNPRRWLFRCECGTEKVLIGSLVRYGATISCGCFRKESCAAARSIDLSGVRVGRLLVVEQLAERDKNGCVQWACACDCGNQTTSITRILKAGLKQSCGCLRSDLTRALGASSKQENPISRTPEYRRANRRKRRQRPENLIAERVSRLMAWALASVGAIKTSGTFEMLGYTPGDLRAHIERQFLPGMSWANRSEWELDHITPISTATCLQDIIALNQLSNLRPLWALHNNQKNNRRHYLL